MPTTPELAQRVQVLEGLIIGTADRRGLAVQIEDLSTQVHEEQQLMREIRDSQNRVLARLDGIEENERRVRAIVYRVAGVLALLILGNSAVDPSVLAKLVPMLGGAN